MGVTGLGRTIGASDVSVRLSATYFCRQPPHRLPHLRTIVPT